LNKINEKKNEKMFVAILEKEELQKTAVKKIQETRKKYS